MSWHSDPYPSELFWRQLANPTRTTVMNLNRFAARWFLLQKPKRLTWVSELCSMTNWFVRDELTAKHVRLPMQQVASCRYEIDVDELRCCSFNTGKLVAEQALAALREEFACGRCYATMPEFFVSREAFRVSLYAYATFARLPGTEQEYEPSAYRR